MSSLAAFSKEQLPEVEVVMQSFLKQHTSDLKLLEAMEYSIAAGGKRIRPLFVLTIAAGFQGELTQDAYQAAAAVEMIHTYSLIHDDLPAMDDDDLRRGQATNHKVFGEALAILAGDGLLTAAFQLLAQADLPAAINLALVQELAAAAGTEGMVAGQSADIQGENQALSLSELMAVHERKTGALITYSIVAGGLLTRQSTTIISLLRKIAGHLGLAFQIRDDLLDVVSTTEALGKTVGRDQALAKSTYPALLGVKGAKEALQKELTAARETVREIQQATTFNADFLQQLIDRFELA